MGKCVESGGGGVEMLGECRRDVWGVRKSVVELRGDLRECEEV